MDSEGQESSHPFTGWFKLRVSDEAACEPLAQARGTLRLHGERTHLKLSASDLLLGGLSSGLAECPHSMAAGCPQHD